MEKQKLHIRRYQETDFEAVCYLFDAAMRGDRAIPDAVQRWASDLLDIEGVYVHAGGEFLVGVLENQVIAMGAIQRISDDTAEMVRIRVHPDYYRRGFGKAIVDALECRAREIGYTSIVLHTTTKQVAAQGLYHKADYQRVSQQNIEGYEIIFYEKHL